MLPSTVTWINPAGGNWDTASNWSTGQLPGPNDDVTISLAANGFTVTHAAGVTESAHSLTSNANLTLTGGVLDLTSPSMVTGAFTLTGGTLQGDGTGTLTAQGSTSRRASGMRSQVSRARRSR